jgi:hypothetical protein
MITELLCYPLDAAAAAERADGRGDGLPDLPGAEFFGALQGRHEQGVGTDGADAEVVHRWPHREPPRQADTSTTQPEYDIHRLMQFNQKDPVDRRNSSPAAAPCATAGQFQRAWPAVLATHASRLQQAHP